LRGPEQAAPREEPAQTAKGDKADEREATPGHMILYHGYAPPLTGGKHESMYKPREVETRLGPLLRQARGLNAVEPPKHQWKYQNRNQQLIAQHFERN